MTKIRSGGCSCGAVRYQLEGEPFLFGLCHCTACRKESGSVVVAYAKWRLDQFETEGETRTHAGRSFCPICGSRLFNLHEDRGEVELRIGSLDEAPTSIGPPTREGWIHRRETWLPPIDGAMQCQGDPPADP